MEVCLAHLHGEPVMLKVENGMVYLDEELQPIKNLSEEELTTFTEGIHAVPYSTDPGYQAMINAKRAAFIVSLLGRAVGEECVDRLSHILDHLHYDVLEYLGETGDNDA